MDLDAALARQLQVTESVADYRPRENGALRITS